MPSKSDNCGDWNFRIRAVRKPRRLRLLDKVREVCRAQRETMTDFLLRAVAGELLRYRRKLAASPLADRIAADDLAELEVLAMLTKEDKQRFGLL